jgi:integrase
MSATPSETPRRIARFAPLAPLAQFGRAALGLVLDTALPPLCAACRQPLGGSGGLCAACWSKVSFIAPPYCERLGRHSHPAEKPLCHKKPLQDNDICERSCTIRLYYQTGPVMAAGKEYLKRRNHSWYFVIAVPRPLREKFRANEIVKSLGTRDITIARQKRWPLKVEAEKTFARLAEGAPLTNGDIAAEAAKAYDTMVAALEINPPTADPEPPPTIDDVEDTREQAGLRYLAEDLQEALEGGEVAMATREVAAAEKRLGVTLDRESALYHQLAMAIIRAKAEAVWGRMAALKGLPVDPPAFIDTATLKPVTRTPRLRHKAQGKLFAEAAAEFLAEMKDVLPASAWTRHETIFRLFTEFCGNAALAEVNRRMAAEFCDAVAKLDPTWAKHKGAKALSFAKLLDRYPGRTAPNTVDKYISALSALYKRARKRGDIETNPFTEQRPARSRQKKIGWAPYTIEELNTLFSAKAFKAERIRPSRHDFSSTLAWLPLIALFSGMREGEICQLRKVDLRTDGGIHFFNVTEEGEGQSVKTEAGVRKVPVHSELIRCGLLDYIKALPAGSLFPWIEGKRDAAFADRFHKFRKSIGLTRPRLSFHSLRKNFTGALDEAGVLRSDAAAIVGHERGFTYDVYSAGPGLARLQNIVEKVGYGGLQIAHLYV